MLWKWNGIKKMKNKYCKDCLYFQLTAEKIETIVGQGKQMEGICRRYPPTIQLLHIPVSNPMTGQMETQQIQAVMRPQVGPIDTCGEFQGKE